MNRLLGLAITTLLGAGWVTAAERPNIVFLFTDDQDVSSVGCYGNAEVKTPHIDRIGAEGIRFNNHYVTTAICMASRASVMTGLYEYRTGCNFGRGALSEDLWQQSYPLVLRKAGYRTAFAGKFGFEIGPSGQAKGRLGEKDFDVWGGGPGQTHFVTAKNPSMKKYAKEFPHASRAYGAFGRDFIQGAAKDGVPFCLSISFKAPHRPVDPDPAFDGVYAGARFTKPENFGRAAGTHFSEQSRRGRQYPRFEEWGYDKAYDQTLAKYYQLVYGVDQAVGMILDALDDTGVADNTVVIFTSDNGYFNGAHGYGSKVLPYEESSRVPLLIRDPRKDTGGQVSEALTGSIDFAPTILKLAGVKDSAKRDGVSLTPLLHNPAAEVREQLSLINVWGEKATHSLSVVTRDWKYILWNAAGDGMSPSAELYYTAEDPMELRNLAADPAANGALIEMQGRYDDALAAWKRDAIDAAGYPDYATYFKRGTPWNMKK